MAICNLISFNSNKVQKLLRVDLAALNIPAYTFSKLYVLSVLAEPAV